MPSTTHLRLVSSNTQKHINTHNIQNTDTCK